MTSTEIPLRFPDHLQDLVTSRRFKDWFGDWQDETGECSRVVDKEGGPRLVYHGTQREFDSFEPGIAKKVSRTKAEGIGIFFADRQDVAASYGKNLIPAFLNLRKPYVNEESGTWKQMKLSNGEALSGAPPAAQQGYQIVPADKVPPEAIIEQEVRGGKYLSVKVPYPTVASINRVVKWASDSGCDGVIAHDLFDMGSDVGQKIQSTTYVALDPSQIWIVGT